MDGHFRARPDNSPQGASDGQIPDGAVDDIKTVDAPEERAEMRFDTGEHATFDGRELAVVGPTCVGPITVSVSADGFESVTASLKAAAVKGATVPASA
ncbi:hypothetical protein ACRJ4B_10235 [Streptomyces sp. GTA36]